MNKITLEALEVLDAIDRRGSFAAAAAAMYRVPSKITYTVRKLEEDLGVILFVREGRRSVLTPAGRLLLEQGRELLDAAERLVENTRKTHSGWESCFNISIDSIIDINRFNPFLQSFYELQTGVEINLYEDVLGGAWERIIEGTVDLVIGVTDMLDNTQGLSVEKLFDTQWVFAVSKKHPLRQLNRPLTKEDIQQYRAVVARDSARHRPTITKRILEKQARLSVQTIEQKIAAQIIGHGVGFLPRHRIQPLLDKGQLFALELEQPAEDSATYMVWRANNKGKSLNWFVKRILTKGSTDTLVGVHQIALL